MKTLVLFGQPIDRVAFDEHFERHCQSVLLRIDNVQYVAVNRIAGAAKGDSPFYLIVELHFASEEAMQQGLNSEAGQVMARDLGQFASGGVTVLFAQVATESRAPAEGGNVT